MQQMPPYILQVSQGGTPTVPKLAGTRPRCRHFADRSPRARPHFLRRVLVGPPRRRRPALRAAELSCIARHNLSSAARNSRPALSPSKGRSAHPTGAPVDRPPQAVFAVQHSQFLLCGGCTATRRYFTVAAGSCVRVAFLAPGAPRADPSASGEIPSATGLRLDLCSCVVQQTSSSRVLNGAPSRKDASPSLRSSLSE